MKDYDKSGPQGVTRKLDPAVGRRLPADFPLFVVMLLILALGLFMVLDASYAHASQVHGATKGDPYYFLKQQGQWAAIGIVVLIAMMNQRYWKLSRYGPHALALAFVLLLLVFIPHIGVRAHGAARWIRLGPVQIQPSEIAKLCCVLFLAGHLSRRQRSVKELKPLLIGALGPVLIIALMIIKEPDLGTALSLMTSCFIMLFVGGARPKHLFSIATIGIVCLLIYALMHPYSRERLLSFIEGGGGDQTFSYQVGQSVEALQAGGIRGLGAGHGDAKFFHLPAPYTDFIAATVGEEFGLIGSLLMLGLFFSFTLRGYHIAHRCPNEFGTLLATGLCSMVTVQALLNLAVITRSFPNTGVPLPMVSFGGSSLVLVLMATGLLLSVSRWPDLKQTDGMRRSSRDGVVGLYAAAEGHRPSLIPSGVDRRTAQGW